MIPRTPSYLLLAALAFVAGFFFGVILGYEIGT